ncbi:MAG: glutamine amidotransferase [Prosthecobacter sp.]|uniref:glutamine amidotransferase n=1 Tax=Prosthecobacter sp. TaxID=1965333 RepID=UPI0038FD8820
MPRILWQNTDITWLAAVVVALVLALLVAGYWRSPLRGWRRLAAMLCKLTALALLALCLLDPLWTQQQPKKGENEVIVLVDNSASLETAEQAGDQTRAAQVAAALKSGDADAEWIKVLGEDFRLRLMTAGAQTRSVPHFRALTFDGTRSDLCRTLMTLRTGGSNLAAVVVVSDGNATDASAWKSAGKGAPVFTVLAGKQAPTPDLALLDASVAVSPFEDAPITITTRVAAHGLNGKQGTLSALDEKGKTIATEKIAISGDSPQTARLRIPVAKPGVSFHRLELKCDGVKEATLANNTRLLAADRGTGPYRVLYIAGRPNWEYKFLRRAIAGDDDVQMPSLIRIAKREPKFEWRGRAGESVNPLFRGFGAKDGEEAQRYDQPVLIRLGTRDAKELTDGFPKSSEELFSEYRAIIIDDLEAAFFTQEQMHLIERFVSERGGALLMLGGQESFQAGGYDHTPVGRMLPVYLDRAATGAPVLDARFNLTREGWLESWMRLRTNRDEDEQRLATMPAFHSINQTFSIKPGASILATIADASQTSYPAIVAQRFGEGRVGSVLVADIWRWGMQNEDARKDMERTWRQLMRWLVVDVADSIAFTAETEPADHEHMKLAVRVRDRSFRAQSDAIVKVEITQPDGTKSQLFAEPSLKEAGLFEAEFFATKPGSYRATASVEDAEKRTPLGSKATGWAFDPQADEFAHLEPDTALMQRIASESGGQMLMLDEITKLPEMLKHIRVPVEVTLATPLWHSPWVFVALLLLLGAEWFLRRKGGMA